MDREINPDYRRKLILRRIIYSALALAGIAAVLIWGPGWLRPSVSRSRIRTARVDQGPLEATLTAGGSVVPEFEQVVSSPVDARVLRILKRPGAVLSKGDPILELDVSESQLVMDKIDRNIALKENQQDRTRLDLETALINLQSQWEIKNLELQTLISKSAKNRRLYQEGLLSEDERQLTDTQEAKARVELKQLEEAKHSAERSTRTQIDGLALEMQILQKERTEAQRLLHLATTKADRPGVLTWVVQEEGATVHKGELIARIADLNSYRVQATISDIHAKRISVGLPVKVKINEEFLNGSISSILPTIQNGIITLQVLLENKTSTLLRSNLRVDVLIITDYRDRVLRIKKGPFADGEGNREVFVVRGQTAIKTPIRLGISSFDHYELLQGLLEGDEVIISDMRDYLHLKEVTIRP